MSDSTQRPNDLIPLSMFTLNVPLNWELSKVRTFASFDSFSFLLCPLILWLFNCTESEGPLFVLQGFPQKTC